MELWKAIETFENYEISCKGRVRNTKRLHHKTGGIIKPFESRGYHRVNLFKGGKEHKKNVHRLVAEAYIVNTENKSLVHHIDEIKINNCKSNLKWATHKENVNYSLPSRDISKTSCRYPKGLKINVLTFISLGNSITKTHLKFGISRKTISRWIKQEEEL